MLGQDTAGVKEFFSLSLPGSISENRYNIAAS